MLEAQELGSEDQLTADGAEQLHQACKEVLEKEIVGSLPLEVGKKPSCSFKSAVQLDVLGIGTDVGIDSCNYR